MSNIKIARDNFKGKGTAAPVARALNKAGRNLNGIRMEGGGNVQKFGNQIVIPRSVSIFPFSKFAFGFSISKATVTVKAGEVHWGITVIEVPERNMTISEDYSFIGLETDGATADLIGPSTNVSTFRSDNTKVRIWLYQFRYTPPETEEGSGSASFHRIGHLGNLIIPGNFA